MPKNNKKSRNWKPWTLRFRDDQQTDLIKKAARLKRVSFNSFVSVLAERAAEAVLANKPRAIVDFVEDAFVADSQIER